jgi:AcrR family transcriptional regulator
MSKFSLNNKGDLMPRTKKQFEEMRYETREKIKTTAMHLFVQKGFGSTNVQEIADIAGISIGLLYRHYKLKEDLFNELVEFALTEIEKIIDIFRSDDSPKKLMDQFVSEIYNDMISGEELANLLILMRQAYFSGGINLQQNEAARLNSRLIHTTAELIQKGQALGEFRSGNAYEMSMFFYSAIQGLAEMKVLLKNNFIMPDPSILTGFLYRDG